MLSADNLCDFSAIFTERVTLDAMAIISWRSILRCLDLMFDEHMRMGAFHVAEAHIGSSELSFRDIRFPSPAVCEICQRPLTIRLDRCTDSKLLEAIVSRLTDDAQESTKSAQDQYPPPFLELWPSFSPEHQTVPPPFPNIAPLFPIDLLKGADIHPYDPKP